MLSEHEALKEALDLLEETRIRLSQQHGDNGGSHWDERLAPVLEAYNADQPVKYYFLSATQIDGEHHHTCRMIVERPTMDDEQAMRELVEHFAFGFDEDQEGLDYDDFSTYGDGLTAITHPSWREIEKHEYDILRDIAF